MLNKVIFKFNFLENLPGSAMSVWDQWNPEISKNKTKLSLLRNNSVRNYLNNIYRIKKIIYSLGFCGRWLRIWCYFFDFRNDGTNMVGRKRFSPVKKSIKSGKKLKNMNCGGQDFFMCFNFTDYECKTADQ